MRSQTLFPRIRQLLNISAVVSPLLLFFAFLIFARLEGMWFLIPLIPALFCFHAFPPFIPDAPSRYSQANDADLPGMRWIRRLGELLVLIWFVQAPVPELHAFVERVRATHALWDWSLLLGFGLLSIGAILRGRSRIGLISDQDIYNYYSMITPPTAAQSDPASGGG